MAFDQPTRNRLQRFVNDVRRVLEGEFTRQLQNDYGMDPNEGSVAELTSLRHVNDAQRETARILRDTLAHYTASGDMNATQGLDRVVREQAFTVLNRLAALRMAEARGLLVESVGNGFQAKGFQLYARLAGTGQGETGDAYRVYLFSVFDELAQDLPGLFDRYSPQGRLFPREAALLQVLNLINDAEIAPLWGEDETIGWIYQYFNSKEERKAMRDASQAPRNSRELAVRNQFFTPRYVVEFLVDNTLGRLWFNATGGTTDLRARCHYMLARLDEGSQAAAMLRDPRTLKLLDPACGSMHFGLYAFDLFVEIYREAWAWEQQHGPGSLDVSTQPRAALNPLSQTYEGEAAFLRDVPRLIIEHNIYGVDIDSRAAQIASLALWLRAQRAWHEAGMSAKDRPLIGRGHVVAAVAPPAERELREQFTADLEPQDAELFEETLQMLRRLPELGVLLEVERELPQLVRRVYVGKGTSLFVQQEQEEWQQAEARLREALTQFAQAARSGYQGRLFAQDALQGLRLIDLCREVFDVVVMNPPFGEPSEHSREYLEDKHGAARADLDAVFVSRAAQLLAPGGRLGGIFNRTQFFKSHLEQWRDSNLLVDRHLDVCVDLGYGVLDGAMVEAACYTTTPARGDGSVTVISVLKSVDKSEALVVAVSKLLEGSAPDVYSVKLKDLLAIPGHRLSYRISASLLEVLRTQPRLEGNIAYARQGLITSDNERFLRLAWEVDADKIGTSKGEFEGDGIAPSKRWAYYAKGGEYSPYYSDLHLVVNWQNDGKEIRNLFRSGKLASRPQNTQFFFLPALTYTERTASDLSVRAMPRGCIFDCKGPILAPASEKTDLLALLALANSKIFAYFVELSLAAGDSSTSGTAARQYTQSIVGNVPVPVELSRRSATLRMHALETWKALGELSRSEETSPFFAAPDAIRLSRGRPIEEAALAFRDSRLAAFLRVLQHTYEIEQEVADLYSLDSDARREIAELCGLHPLQYQQGDASEEISSEVVELYEQGVDASVSRFLEEGSADRAITKRSYYADRLVEVICHGFRIHPSVCVGIIQSRARIGDGAVQRLLEDILSYSVGVAFGRFDWRLSTDERPPILEHGPFDSIPLQRPGMTPHETSCSDKNSELLVDDPGHRQDLAHLIEEVLLKVGVPVPHDVRAWLRRDFFAEHLQRYSNSRRNAPVYWPLGTASGSYSLWLYYPRLGSQTLYTAVNDFVDPKLKQVGGDVMTFQNRGASRTRDDETKFESARALELELIELRDTLLKLASTYNPNHDDGVQISAAPLWPLFRHKPWQKVLKDTWAKLERGDFDWAHLAMNYWPERVREKCKTDKSLAIAHGLEDLYIQPESKQTKARGKKKARGGE